MSDPLVSAEDAAAKRRALRELIAYFGLTFAITFGLGGTVIFFRPQFEAVFGPLGPPLVSWPYYVCVAAPTISAVLLSLAFGGLQGLKTLFGGLIRPFKLRWLFAALLTIPSAFLIWGLIERNLFGGSAPHSVDIHAILITAPLLWFTTAKIFIDPGPWGEETGWRGFALPRLLTRFTPLTAAIILGVIWGLWHTPAFLASGLTQSGTSFGWFLVETPCLSIIMTWIYVNANRNYLVAGMVPHAVTNLMGTAAVYSDIKVEAMIAIAIAVTIVAVSGPGLRGWRFARRRQAAA